jgi:hypothetical protein
MDLGDDEARNEYAGEGQQEFNRQTEVSCESTFGTIVSCETVASHQGREHPS